MTNHTRTRRGQRPLAGLAVGAVVAAVTALAPSPAQAATTMTGSVGVASGYEVSGATCSGSGGMETSANFSSAGGAKTVTASDDGSTSNSGDMTDNATWSSTATTTAKATQTATGATLSVSTTLNAALDADLGEASACAPAAIGQMSTIVVVAVAQSGWLSIDASLPRSTDFGFSLVPLSGGGVVTPVAAETTGQLTYAGDLWVDPGQYVLTLGVQAQADEDPATNYRPTMSGKATITATLSSAGAARSAASGPGKSYVALPSALNCGDGSVAVPFTQKASKAASATFFVNGKKKTTITTPQPGTAVVLKGVTGSGGTAIEVVVDPKSGKNVTATRSYLACS